MVKCNGKTLFLNDESNKGEFPFQHKVPLWTLGYFIFILILLLKIIISFG